MYRTKTNPDGTTQLWTDQSKTYPNGTSQLLLTDQLYSEIYNFRLTSDGVLLSDRGYEPFKIFTTGDDHFYVSDDVEPIRFLGIWSRHQGAEVYYFYEQNGYLQYCWGNGDSIAGVDRFVLDFNRQIPSPQQVGTQLIDCGRFCIFANGVDAPIKFWGNERFSSFGGSEPPHLILYDIDPSFVSSGKLSGGPSTALGFDNDGGAYGITPYQEGTYNFGYKYSAIYDSGSEGPLSSESVLDFNAEDADKRRYVAFGTLPERPNNVVAYNIYRTKQRQNGSADVGEYYYVKTIKDNRTNIWSDHFPDDMLTTFAPGFGGSENPIIATDYFHYGCVWDGRLWISGGSYQDQVLYSARQSFDPIQGFETFEANNNFSFGTGGKITAVKELGDQYLVIFQENAINLITRQVDGTYQTLKLSDLIGTTATNTIQKTVNQDLIFLTTDGFYQIQSGEQFPKLNKLSNNINKKMLELSTYALPRATACYNKTEQEYWCHFPIRGSDENGLGVVIHNTGLMTFRGPLEGAHSLNMAFTQLASDGRLTVIGTYPYDAEVDDGDDFHTFPNGSWKNVGLQVWTARKTWGELLTDAQNGGPAQDGDQFTHTDVSKGASRFLTNWLNCDTLDKKSIQAVELICLNTTIEPFELLYAINGNDDDYLSMDSKQLILSERSNLNVDPTYGTAEWGVDPASEYNQIKVRYNLNSREIFSIRLKGNTTNLLGLLGINLIFHPTPTKSLKGVS